MVRWASGPFFSVLDDSGVLVEFRKAKGLSSLAKALAVLVKALVEKTSFVGGLAFVDAAKFPYKFANSSKGGTGWEEWLGVEYWLGVECCPELGGT